MGTRDAQRSPSSGPPGAAQSCGTFARQISHGSYDPQPQAQPGTASPTAVSSRSRREERLLHSLKQSTTREEERAQGRREGSPRGGSGRRWGRARILPHPGSASVLRTCTGPHLLHKCFPVYPSTVNENVVCKRYGCNNTLGAGFTIFRPNQNYAWEDG